MDQRVSTSFSKGGVVALEENTVRIWNTYNEEKQECRLMPLQVGEKIACHEDEYRLRLWMRWKVAIPGFKAKKRTFLSPYRLTSS
jgi:hypothetical protein